MSAKLRSFSYFFGVGKHLRKSFAGLSVALLAIPVFSSAPAVAVPVFNTSLELNIFNQVFATGTDFVSGCNTTFAGPNNGFVCGTVDINGTDIDFSASGGTGQGTRASIDARGEYTYDDLIFSSIGSPSGGGTINVSANIVFDWTTNDSVAFRDRFIVAVNINEGGNEFNTTFGTPTSQSATTASASVPLDIPVTLTVIGDLRIADEIPGNENGNGFLGLGDIPFNLPEGFTVNSESAGIFDNSFDPPDQNNGNQVPEPGTFALLGLGLAGLGFIRRRRPAA